MLPEPIASGLDRFQVLSRLGQGGMGTVYGVFDRVRATRMALKTIGPAGGKALLRFKREFRAICEIRHPNIVRLGELFEVQGAWYYTMELVDGLDLVSYARASTDEPQNSNTDPDSGGSSPSGLRRAYSGETSARRAGALHADTKLRHALGQLVDALRVLHERERVHRDVKPSNVLVTREGRVVLLDFGLVADRGEDSDGNEVAGTIAYMAPEQADAKPAGPEADFYAVGIMLYEALTGTLPFGGESASILVQKSKGSFRSPSELASDLPEDLVALCIALLSPHPDQRPKAFEILLRLRGEDGAKGPSGQPSQQPTRAAFAGRKEQLALIEDAFEATRGKRAQAVLVRGPSGFGKTALVEHFLASLKEREGSQLLILRGRCRQYEEVSFNAFDSVIDTLSGVIPSWQRLRGVLSRDQIAAMQRAFPVLERVSGQSYIDLQRADVKQLRVALHEGLRGLLRVFSATRHIVIALDDMQWADAESWSLLHELTRAPDPPGVLVILTARPEVRPDVLPDEDGARVLSQVVSTVIDLQQLDEAESRELAAGMADSHALSPQAVEELLREGSGNPMLLTTMLRSGLSDLTAPRLADVLLHQVHQQSADGRQIIEAVCLASAPIDRNAIARTLDRAPAAITAAVDEAIDGRLLRFSGASAKSPIEPYHDQIRQAVLDTIDEARRRVLHRALALSLDAEEGAREQALYHYREAGDQTALARCAEAAGDHAMKVLAFERALRLFDEALAASRPDGEMGDALQRKRADALSHAGRALQAAEAYLALASKGRPEEALELRRVAAAHLLSVAEVARGKQVLGEVMNELGLSMPQSTTQALLRALWLRARLRVRGMRIVLDEKRKPDSMTLARLETCASSAYMFSVLDPILGTYLSCLHAVHALSAGDFEHALRALSTEGGYRCLIGNQEDGLALMQRAKDLAHAEVSPRLTATLTASDAAIAWALSDFRRALKLAREAHRLFSTKCQRVAWELVTLELVEITSLFFLGCYRELSHRVPICLRAAQGRDDRYGTTNMLVSQASTRFLSADDPQGALAAVDQGMNIWPSTGFDMHHLMALQMRIYAYLYEGDVQKARTTFAEAEQALKKSFLLRLTAYRVLALYIECQALLADDTWRETPRIRQRLRELLRSLSVLRSPLSDAFAACVDLTLCWPEASDREQRLTKALTRIEQAGLRGHAAALRLRAAESGHLPTESERALVATGLSFLLEQGVQLPERFIRALCPPLSPAPKSDAA